jgi:hypothetical protein
VVGHHLEGNDTQGGEVTMAQPAKKTTEGQSPELESVRKVVVSMLEQALQAMQDWPSADSRRRLWKIRPLLCDGLRRLAS